ncbi:MAG: hypothetical protein KatS3mg111_1757 [Pirellulaceae bacterium]|nr:MAG: hypothetical protein KatS3mg111_1757 [Pirellulaceae bacterium]
MWTRIIPGIAGNMGQPNCRIPGLVRIATLAALLLCATLNGWFGHAISVVRAMQEGPPRRAPSAAMPRGSQTAEIDGVASPSEANHEGKDAVTSGINAHQVAQRLLLLALRDAVWGPAVLCDVRQTVWMDGQQWTGVGKYVRAGEGTGKLKFQLQMPGRTTAHALLQISDGQRLHTIEQLSKTNRHVIVDLEAVRERLHLTKQNIDSPMTTLYLAIGGQAESIRTIYGQYHFVALRLSDEGGQAWVLEGRLADSPPPLLPLAQVDQQLILLGQSGAMPNRLRLRIREIARRSESELPLYWLDTVEWERTKSEHQPELRLVTEWGDPHFLEDRIDDAVFEYHATKSAFDDHTARYLPPPTE